MSSREMLFQRIAEDVGVKRYEGESSEDYCIRAAYTAARFWISAFCLDDGAEGTNGVSKQVITRRLRVWLNSLDKVCPGIGTWFETDQGGIPSIYNRLINIEEIVPYGFTNKVRAQPPKLLPASKGHALIVGAFDPTNRVDSVLGFAPESIVATGIASFVTSEVDCPSRQPNWWEAEWDFLGWSFASDYDTIEYANLEAHSWSLGQEDSWSPNAQFIDGMALAKTIANTHGGVSYHAVKPGRQGPLLCAITQAMAYELYYHLRFSAGNPIEARIRHLDEQHVQLVMPLGLIPGECDRVLEVVSWPVRKVSDRYKRVARTECVPMVRELLSECNVVLRGV